MKSTSRFSVMEKKMKMQPAVKEKHSIMSLLGKANESVDLVKAALDAKVALATADDKEKLADAKLALADLKQIIADLKEENQSLREQVKEKDELVLDRGVWWKKEDVSNKVQPFCPACRSKARIVPLQKLWDGADKTQSLWRCPEKSCMAIYNPWDYKEPDSGPMTAGNSLFNFDNEY